MKLIIGSRYTDEIKELQDLGCDVITFNGSKALDDEINCHADINVFNCNNGVLIINSDIIGESEPYLKGFKLIECKGIKSPYPDDIKLNCALIGKYLLCNTRFIADEITTFCKNNNIEPLHTNQGYSKCSVCVLNDNAVITEDTAIASLLKNCQIDVLLIEKGYVSLSDKHFGFIGGASGMLNTDTLYVSGDISEHPSYNDILKFLDKHHIKLVFNKSRKLNDFGGFIKLD